MNRHAALLVAFAFFVALLSPLETAAAVLTDSLKPSVAVFVPENLSGKPAPLKVLRESLIRDVASIGISILDDASLERFMLRHRVRYTGGIDGDSALALKTEEKIDAVLISSVTLYDESSPPKLSVIARLVSTGERPAIMWMGSASVSGDDSRGILGIGLITDPVELREKVVGSLVRSLAVQLSGEKAEAKPTKGRYRPKIFYQSDSFSPGTGYAVAVAPFLNFSDRKYAGDIIVLHFIEELLKNGFDVVEPGVLRQKLLNMRIIMNEGITLKDADVISLGLNADLVLAGKVNDYEDYTGPEGSPRVDFSVLIIEKMTKKVLWSSKSYNRGDDGVFFFDRGKVSTADRLATYMTSAIVEKISQPGVEVEGEPGLGELPFSPRRTE
ncbi:putative Lipoprotein [Candidatus Sulfobium mesophilum]|uniref:Putative Lipoprotein n=1 Tax=Candidatus Sulfobium mesophilum TaxID=2016548 RepID=A0A2U3QGS2_9BACT|nr:putative Lipoprotein [Candidatus Sulfobium mesophilum]